MSDGNEEIPATLRRKRRSWTLEEKRRIVGESLEDGASLAEVARRHDLNANQLFTWRRQFGVEPAEPKDIAPILPVRITSETAAEEFRSGIERPDGNRSCGRRPDHRLG